MRCEDQMLRQRAALTTVLKGCGSAWSGTPGHKGPRAGQSVAQLAWDVFSFSLSFFLFF